MSTKAILFDFFGVIEQGGQPNTEILEFLEANNSKYVFGILSAAAVDLHLWLLEHRMADYFAIVQTTAKVGISKDQPEFYQNALEILQIQPKQAVFVDNTLQYVELANKLGLKSLLYDRNKNFLSQIKPLL